MPDNQPSTPDSANVDRTATGAIADKGQTTAPAATTPQTSTQPETSTPTDDKSILSQDGKSLANQGTSEAPASEGAPEAYSEFKVPEGFMLDAEVSKEVGGLFKKMNLTQAQAQELIDFHVKTSNDAFNQPFETWRRMQAEWQKEVRADPVLGRNLQGVTNTISRAIDVVSKNNPQLAEGFRTAMDFTGAGNNPHFIRMFYEMAQMITEGGHVSGKGPSPAGQTQKGDIPSAARAMYPNLP